MDWKSIAETVAIEVSIASPCVELCPAGRLVFRTPAVTPPACFEGKLGNQHTQQTLCHQPPTPSSINPSFCSRYTLFPRPSPRSIFLTPIRAQLLKWTQCAHFCPICTSAPSRIAGLSVLLTRQQSQPPFLDIIITIILIVIRWLCWFTFAFVSIKSIGAVLTINQRFQTHSRLNAKTSR